MFGFSIEEVAVLAAEPMPTNEINQVECPFQEDPIIEVLQEVTNIEIEVEYEEAQLGDAEIRNAENHLDVANEEVSEPNNNINEEHAEDIDALPKKKRSRKHLPMPGTWLRNVRKKNHQAGKEYINQKGIVVPPKKVTTKKDCLNACKLKCAKHITEDERRSIFSGYYKLASHNEKSLFLINHTERTTKTRKTTNEENPPRRNFSFKYYFTVKNKKLQVCKTYFLSTLSISQKSIYNVHNNKDIDTNIPKPDGRGLYKSTTISETDKNDVRKHIDSFPKVESHYCRSDTRKQYLESTLSISQMYNLFKEKYPDSVIKDSMYRRIFVTEYNLDFHVPKKDRCDLCEEYKVSVKEKLPFDESRYENHISAKNKMREDRIKDAKSDDPVFCFDLQNVITCPRAEISSFFYYSKLSVYNVTAHLKTKHGKKVFCAVWPETMGGRTGNDIASAVFKILSKVLEEDPTIEHLITWSDSCVPQNKNQMMSGAMMLLLQNNPQVQSITMKYSTPGHGAVQVVDNIHSHIEKAMVTSEFYSPVGLLKILKHVNKKNPYVVIQMQHKDFLDFADSSKEFFFQQVPFTKLCSITFTQVFGEINYMEANSTDSKTVNIKSASKAKERCRRKSPDSTSDSPRTNLLGYKAPRAILKPQILSTNKKRDLKLMERFMPLLDREYYKCILK